MNLNFADLFKLLWEWLKGLADYNPNPTPPDPDPVTPPDPVSPLEPPAEPGPTDESFIICDLATLPEQMRADGIMLKDNALYYGVACAWAGHGWTHNEETAPIIALSDQIQGWFEALIQEAAVKLRMNPNLTAVAIANDGRDRCGFIIGPVIMERFGGFGNRVTLGDIVPESEY